MVVAANFLPKSRAATVVDYAKPDRAPLLPIAGGRDHIVLSSVAYEHLTAALDGWTDVADYALTWTAGHSG